MKITTLLFLGIITSLLISCDCLRQAEGTVIDFDTKEPIDSAIVKISNKIGENYFCITDESGKFEISDISGGLFVCPDMPLIVKKEGYDSIAIEVKDTITIQLHRKLN